jgi:DNA polymerase-3 subunit alpha
MSLKFFNLHGHTGFSLYDGYGAIEDFADFMLQNAGEDSGGFAITDHGHINSAGYFSAAQRKFKQKGTPVKLIWGCEFYYIPSIDSWTALKAIKDEEKKEEKKTKKKKDKEESEEGLVFENEKESKSKYFDPINRRHHLVITAYNQKGLSNLFRLVSRSHREGFYRKPRIDLKMLQQFNEGLVASSACLAGIPNWCTMQSTSMEQAHAMYDKEALPVMEIFGKERFYLELQFNKIPEQQIVNQHIVEYSKKTGYNLIVTADSHYPRPEDWRSREIYRMLGYQLNKEDDIDKSIMDKTADELDAHLYLKNGDQLFKSFKDSDFGKIEGNDLLVSQAIERTHDLAHNFFENVFSDEKTKLPKPSSIAENKTSFEVLKELCVAALKKKNKYENKVYFDRLIIELKVIKGLGFSDYFLVLKEIIDALKKHMLIGPGRGSGAGSLVNYLLGITLVDPIEDGLLFERFLSPSRKELPDIDSDVELRKEALEILKGVFGEDNVLAISNYNKLQLKSIIKDLSKLHGVPFAEVNAVNAVIEREAKDKILEEINFDQKLYELSFEKAKKYSPTFRAFIEKYPPVAEHMEALYQETKSIGKHAGGIIIIPDAESCLPIIRCGGIDQSPITEGITAQHTKFFGLVKYDVLGVKTLEIIKRAIEVILKNQGNAKPTIDDVWEFYNKHLHPDVINKSDEKVFESTYNVKKFPSVFQFAESKVQNFCYKAQPRNLYDLAAITALWRPGPLKGHADKGYLDYSPEALAKEHPIIQQEMGETRGLLLYQEQFMLLANKLAGFSLEEADQLRKILVKPSTELGEELRKKRIEAGEKFIQGCIDKGLTEKRAKRLWDQEIMGFISYGFNKSHAVAYAYNSYHCAWLYTYYPNEWIKACLEKDADPANAIAVVRSLGYDVSRVDVNYSAVNEWSFNGESWLPPLTSLKGLGEVGACELVNARPEGGFKNVKDFFFNEYGFWRWSKLNKKNLNSLLKIETMKSLSDIGEDKLFKNYNHLEAFLMADKNLDKIKKGKLSFDDAGLMDVPDYTTAERILFQKEIVGFYDKSLVLNKYLPIFENFNIEAVDAEEEDGPKPKVWGIVENCVQDRTKKGKVFYRITVSGLSGKEYRVKAWIKESESVLWAVGNVLVFGLDYSSEWGYNLSRKSKIIKVTK